MPLNHQDQLTVLRDILNNHQIDCCGSSSECEQLERLVKSLMVNPNINGNILPTLNEIYHYSQDGQNNLNLDQHIEAHKDNLSQWVSDMDSYS